jgi:hypothetical protein
MGQMVLLVLPLVVRLKELLHNMPHGLEGVCLIPHVRINKRDRVMYGAVHVTDGPNIPVHSPAITDDSSARLDPSMYYIHCYVGGSIWYGNKESSTRFAFYTAKHPLSLNRVSPMVLRRPNLLSVSKLHTSSVVTK